MNIPIKYIPKRLTNKDKKEQLKQLKKSRGLYKKGKYHTRKKAKSFKNKKSSHVKNAMKIYNVKDVVPSKILSKKTGCTLSSLNKIVKKGQGAYYSSGSRPNQTAHSWGYARLASAITGGKSAAVDFHILRKGCKKTGKAYKYALKSTKKHKHGRRKVEKFKGGASLESLNIRADDNEMRASVDNLYEILYDPNSTMHEEELAKLVENSINALIFDEMTIAEQNERKSLLSYILSPNRDSEKQNAYLSKYLRDYAGDILRNILLQNPDNANELSEDSIFKYITGIASN